MNSAPALPRQYTCALHCEAEISVSHTLGPLTTATLDTAPTISHVICVSVREQKPREDILKRENQVPLGQEMKYSL